MTLETPLQKLFKLPPSAFAGLAAGSLAASLLLMAASKRQWALFIAQWVPSFLILGASSQLAKTAPLSAAKPPRKQAKAPPPKPQRDFGQPHPTTLTHS